MLKINKSILIICIVSLFLIIGQISASDTDLMKISDSNTNYDTLERSDINIETSLNTNSLETKTNDQANDQFYSKNVNQGEDNNYSDETTENIETIVKDTAGIVMANDDYSCGPASLATVLNRNGLNLSLNEVSEHTNTSVNGTNMQSLIDAAKYYKFTAIGVEIDSSNLGENFIVHLNIDGSEHWTVITKLTDTHVFLADSTAGNINLSIDDFNSCFTKKAIILFNKSSIDFKEQTITNQIKILDKDQTLSISGKGFKRKIVGYRVYWKYGWIQKYGWVLRPVVKGGHVSFSQWQYVKGYYSVWGRYKVKEPIYRYYYVNNEALTSAKIKRK